MACKTIEDLPALVTATGTLLIPVDDGTETFKATLNQIKAFGIYIEDEENWDGVIYTYTYGVEAYTTNAKLFNWTFRDEANNGKQMSGVEIDFPTATDVRVTFGADFPPAIGTYTLVGR